MPKITVEQTTNGHFEIWARGDARSGYYSHGIGEIDIPPQMDIATALRLIAQAVRREAERIERAGAPLVKPEGTNGVQVDGWWV